MLHCKTSFSHDPSAREKETCMIADTIAKQYLLLRAKQLAFCTCTLDMTPFVALAKNSVKYRFVTVFLC